MKRLLKYILSVLVFAGAAILIFFASKVDAKTDPIRKYNNTNYVSTSGEITEDGVITVHMRYEGIRDSAYKAEIRVYIEKRILGLFWTKAALGETGDQWNTTVEDVRYEGSYSFKLPSKGTYRVHVSYTIYGNGGAADVIEEQFTVSYKSTDSNETESLSAPSASESPAPDETQETAVEAPAVLTFSTNDISQIWRESITEDAWEKDPEVYSRVLWSAYPGKTKVRTTDRLPDVLSGTDEKEANKLTGRNYDISSLGISMEIPNGFYLYHVKGQYKDSDGNPVELEFVDEYILTMMDVDEDRLLSDMADYDNKHHTPN